MNTLYIFAGPNGSGKFTIVASYLQRHPEIAFVNADYLELVPEIAAIPDARERSWKAM